MVRNIVPVFLVLFSVWVLPRILKNIKLKLEGMMGNILYDLKQKILQQWSANAKVCVKLWNSLYVEVLVYLTNLTNLRL